MGDDPRVEYHKPAPDIYFRALRSVNERRAREQQQEQEQEQEQPHALATSSPAQIQPEECLVFEDSVQGVEAGRRAGMQVVWCPHEGLLRELLQGEVDEVLEDFRRIFGLDSGVPIRGLEIAALAERIQDATGGWVRLVPTLERFPYAQYGLAE
jgi:pseudouridine-5'-monophosphatase